MTATTTTKTEIISNPHAFMRLIEHRGKTTCAAHFDTVEHAVQAIDSTTHRDHRPGSSRRTACSHWDLCHGKHGDVDLAWYGFGSGVSGLAAPKSMQELYSLLSTKWDKGLEKVESFYRELAESQLNKPRDRRRSPSWSDDNGDDVCYDRIRSGQPFWRTTRRVLSTGPAQVTFFIQVGITSNHDWSETLWRIAAAIAATELLEERGYSVAITAVSYSSDTYTDMSDRDADKLVSINLKEHGQVLDRSNLINTMACWSFRTFWFLLFGYPVAQGTVDYINHGLGRTRTITATTCSWMTNDPASFVFQNCFNEESAKAAAQAAIDVVGSDDWFEWGDDS